MNNSYRDKIKRDLVTVDEILDDQEYYTGENENLILVSDVYSVLDEIEDKVDELVYMLKDIEGLSEINDVKEILEKLSNDLY